MINLDTRLSCRLDGLTSEAREQQRAQTIAELGLLNIENVATFDEATQTAAHFLNFPICIISIVDGNCHRFKSAFGLSRLGLMNPLAKSRQISKLESFCTYVVDSRQAVVISDTLAHPTFASSQLASQYGVRAYVGVPLLTVDEVCVGSLAVMDVVPRQSLERDVEYLKLMARWTMSEFDRRCHPASLARQSPSPIMNLETLAIAQRLQVEILTQLTQELRTPLTSVMGMASVLNREIYGPLTDKQKEYLRIICNSSQYLISLVNEILELTELNTSHQELNTTSVDIEMLCQQAINPLNPAAQRREQKICLSIEPGHRIWSLDKDKVRQMLYYLLFSLIQSSNTGSTIRLHVSHRKTNLVMTIWVTHPWLDGAFYTESSAQPIVLSWMGAVDESSDLSSYSSAEPEFDRQQWTEHLKCDGSMQQSHPDWLSTKSILEDKQHKLGVLLSQQLATIHGGQIAIHPHAESGYRYVVTLPQQPS